MTTLIDQLLCDNQSRKALSSLAANPPRSPLVVVHGPGDLPGQAALAAAFAMVRPDARELDVRLARPDGDRWTVTEVHEQVIKPAQLRPVDRSVIVVDRAEAMDVAAAEHLLKVVEEPPARCVFMFAVPSPASLLTTLRSRTAAEIAVALAPARERAARLAELYDVEPAIARAVVDRCGDLTALAERLVKAEPTVRDALAVFDTPVFSTTPIATSQQVLSQMEVLAALGDPFDMGSAGSKNEQLLRARMRTLMRVLFDRWAAQAQARLGDPSLDRIGFAACTQVALALDEARGQVDRYAPAKNVLAGVLSACAPR